ncbi:extracellular solute-binding protein [Aquibacillus koreensis]|uniref:Extracellular solute-binding protein n=1 Tax=Aquibacillus koreensis TaxID=279446 RepID=A0A9X3WMU9_9BACI|nr:extracellular solute-binding protein [Aquibacillus koreensis]MCT2535227.1 extracellular solute-binding protein [Aquibacillus koreensis]MDC3421086.1 extracellular solute-binding protein [Aquibacillus koreensis]
MNFKKGFGLLIAALIIAVITTACGGDNESGSEDTKTITFMHQWTEGSSPQQNKLLNEVIDEYESENPGITVETETYSAEQYKEKLRVLAASDKLPDVGQGWPGGWLKPFATGGKFAPLDDVIDEEFSNKFVDGTLETFEVDGKTYSLPYELNITMMFYNKEIFNEYGLEKPTTLEELKNVVTVLNENDVTPIALGNKDRWTGSIYYMYLADRIGGSEKIVNAVNRETSFEDPALTQAAEEIQNLVEMDAFPQGTNAMGNLEAEGMFMNGQAAMYLTATWSLPNFTTNEDIPQEFRDNVDYFKFPNVEDGEGDSNSFVGGSGGMFVAENSDVKEEAKQFVKFYVEKLAEKSLSGAGIMPAMKSDTANVELPDLYVQVLEDLNNASGITLFADNLMNTSTAEEHLNAIQALFGLEMTPEEFVELHEESLEQQAQSNEEAFE